MSEEIMVGTLYSQAGGEGAKVVGSVRLTLDARRASDEVIAALMKENEELRAFRDAIMEAFQVNGKRFFADL